jgi:hypothetical protein
MPSAGSHDGFRIEQGYATEEDQMRSDRYQERARALAIEAGVDPDAKIDRPGQRPMPAWCLFRDAARKEHMAREAEAAAADIVNLRLQEPKYQNSPLTVLASTTTPRSRRCAIAWRSATPLPA